ncbi:MAG: hypothetical protein D6718_09730 [Acidobacteria bacterium]|nr:MAG: hypothetical protein D6718_09730 [Acidobacteriota bacterium]
MSIRNPNRPGGAAAAAPRGALDRILDAVGSLTFGIVIMTAILIYCWIGSAGFAPFSDWFVRQSFEKTEMEWFNWWPFHVLLALMCLSLVVATVRKVRLDLPHLGLWLTHGGILVVVLGTVYYFGMKREGDVLVYRRQAVITLPGGSPAAMTLRPGEAVTVRGEGKAYRVQVADLNPHYRLRSGDDAGKETYAAQLFFQPLEGDAHPFIRQLLVGYPQYTEDVLPGRGRAVKVTGEKLVDKDVEVELRYAPADRIYLRDTAAIHVRPAGAGDDAWIELPVPGLPHYNEYALAAADVVVPPGEEHPLRRLEIPVDASPAARLLGEGTRVRVTGFLPFAHLEERWEPGGDEFHPLMRFALHIGNTNASGTLHADAPHPHHVQVGRQLLDVSFKWIESQEELDRLIAPGPSTLVVSVPERHVTRRIRLADAQERAVAVPGTGYKLQVLEVQPHWTLAGEEGGVASMVLVRVTKGDRSFLRAVVTPQVELSQDIDESGHQAGRILDDSIRIEVENLSLPGLTLVAGPVGLHAIVVDGAGQVTHRPAKLGVPVVFPFDDLQVTIAAVSEKARKVLRPVVIPWRERDRKAGMAYAAVQVEIAGPQGAERYWVRYSHYAHPSRAGFFPQRVTLPDGRAIELLFSRRTLPLPAPVALEAFQLETYTGGTRERDYISLVRFREDGGWSDIKEIRSNQPTAYRGWWFFQSTWDPPVPQANYAGMNYTGLGVGNRHGVAIMLWGSLLTVFGTFWAFYIKPILLRRRRAAEAVAAPAAPAPEPELEPVAVGGSTSRSDA